MIARSEARSNAAAASAPALAAEAEAAPSPVEGVAPGLRVSAFAASTAAAAASAAAAGPDAALTSPGVDSPTDVDIPAAGGSAPDNVGVNGTNAANAACAGAEDTDDRTTPVSGAATSGGTGPGHGGGGSVPSVIGDPMYDDPLERDRHCLPLEPLACLNGAPGSAQTLEEVEALLRPLAAPRKPQRNTYALQVALKVPAVKQAAVSRAPSAVLRGPPPPPPPLLPVLGAVATAVAEEAALAAAAAAGAAGGTSASSPNASALDLRTAGSLPVLPSSVLAGAGPLAGAAVLAKVAEAAEAEVAAVTTAAAEAEAAACMASLAGNAPMH